MSQYQSSIKRMLKQPKSIINTGDTEITNYYKDRAWNEMKKYETIVYELRLNGKVIGFYTASMLKLTEKIENTTYMTHPALLLGQMGVDINYHKQGFGSYCIEHIILLAWKMKNYAGCRFVVLEVKKERERLVEFYKNQGFKIAVNQPKKDFFVMYFDLAGLNDQRIGKIN